MFADAHCDYLYKAYIGEADFLNAKTNQAISMQTLADSQTSLQCFAIWTNGKLQSSHYLQALQMISIYTELIKNGKLLGRFEENSNLTCGILCLEGGSALEGKIENLYILHELGVRVLAPVWNDSNELGHGALSSCKDGLTDFGREVIRHMSALDMILDVSHINEKGFWDCINTARCKIMASHSNAYSICPNPRNLKDSQLRAVASLGGYIGVCFYPPFLAEDQTADLEDIIAHMEYIVKLCGISSVGFGSDFDGIEKTPYGIKSPTDFAKIQESFQRKSWSNSDINRICEKNLIEYMRSLLE